MKKKVEFMNLSKPLQAGIYGGWLILGYIILRLLSEMIVKIVSEVKWY